MNKEIMDAFCPMEELAKSAGLEKEAFSLAAIWEWLKNFFARLFGYGKPSKADMGEMARLQNEANRYWNAPMPGKSEAPSDLLPNQSPVDWGKP